MDERQLIAWFKDILEQNLKGSAYSKIEIQAIQAYALLMIVERLDDGRDNGLADRDKPLHGRNE